MSATPEEPISERDYNAAMLYEAMLDRFAKAKDEWGLPMMALRLLAKRHGLDLILRALVTKGPAWVAARCRQEMVIRQAFFTRMIAQHPPPEVSDLEEATNEMANDLVVFDTPAAAMRLLRFLDRLKRREEILNPGYRKDLH